jgi:hypothetical protein
MRTNLSMSGQGLSGNAELTPLGKGGGTVAFEDGPT